MWQSVVVSCVLLVAVSGSTITGPVTASAISQCTNDPGSLPLSASVAGCTAAPCALPQLEDAIIDITFKAPRDITTMTTIATAYLTFLGIQIPIPYDLAEKSVTCNYLLNSSCPVNEGDILQYRLNMFIESIFPVGTVTTIEFSIRDDNNVSLTCIRVPIIIQSPRTQSPQLTN